jgi:colicin import membrane protein
MKKALLTIVGLLFTLFAAARGGNELDPKYGKGAVPQDENGDVYFTQTVKIPGNMSEDICYETLMNWAKGRFAQPYAQAGRILNEDSKTRRFIFHVDQIIVFKSTGFVADESKISYNFSVAVKNGEFTMTMTDIKYRYEEGREGGGKAFTAEDWITDKEAYNRKGTKFLRSTGKFRIKTIDLKDMLFQRATDTVSGNLSM